jgi:hypothetical protein
MPPIEGKKWNNQELFLQKLRETITPLKLYKIYSKKKSCLLCNHKNITTGFYSVNKIRWEDGLEHYINVHNIKPSERFIDFIFRYHFRPIVNKQIARMNGNVIIREKQKKYVKINKNQLFIIDALSNHGGKKLYENRNNFKYSEHAGLLDFNGNELEKILVSAKTNRIDKGDNSIFMPGNVKEMMDYEYIFHTHPPTPKPGGRAEEGIILEMPSISDIFHFIDNHNKGKVQGSIVAAAEGMYIIRKKIFDLKKIKINENKFFSQINKQWNNVQDKIYHDWGEEFSTYDFYSKIAQDKTPIDKFNSVLNKFHMHIDYYPRIKNKNNKWIYDTLYLPIFITEIC